MTSLASRTCLQWDIQELSGCLWLLMAGEGWDGVAAQAPPCRKTTKDIKGNRVLTSCADGTSGKLNCNC